jgi:hypothetical protein
VKFSLFHHILNTNTLTSCICVPYPSNGVTTDRNQSCLYRGL